MSLPVNEQLFPSVLSAFAFRFETSDKRVHTSNNLYVNAIYSYVHERPSSNNPELRRRNFKQAKLTICQRLKYEKFDHMYVSDLARMKDIYKTITGKLTSSGTWAQFTVLTVGRSMLVCWKDSHKMMEGARRQGKKRHPEVQMRAAHQVKTNFSSLRNLSPSLFSVDSDRKSSLRYRS